MNVRYTYFSSISYNLHIYYDQLLCLVYLYDASLQKRLKLFVYSRNEKIPNILHLHASSSFHLRNC